MKKFTLSKAIVLFIALFAYGNIGLAQVTVAYWDFSDAAKRDAANVVPRDIKLYTADIGSGTMDIVGGPVFTGWVGGAVGPEGNRSAANSNTWANGENSKYWVITVSTKGYEDLKLSSYQQGSNTGPKDFKVQYSINGTDWFDIPDATILVANNFTSGVLTDVPLPEACEDQETLHLRWLMTSNASVSNGVVADGGTSRIDGIKLTGVPDFTQLVLAVPTGVATNPFGTGNNERGVATHGDDVYVLSRTAGKVVVFDRFDLGDYASGTSKRTYSYAGTSGGLIGVNDIEISEDGVAFVANVSSATGPFKVYKLMGQDQNVETVIDYTYGAGRFGDKFTLVGNYSEGGAKLYATNAAPGATDVLVWSMEFNPVTDKFEFKNTPDVINIDYNGVFTNGATSVVAPKPDGSFYITGGGNRIHKIEYNDNDGKWMRVGTIMESAVGNSALKFLGTEGNDDIVASMCFGGTQDNIHLFRVVNGDPATASLIFKTPALRVNPNTGGTGDIAFSPRLDGNVDLYVLPTNNGLAGYRTYKLNITPPDYSPDPVALVQVIHNSADPAAVIVDVYINGELAIEDFAFRTATPFITLPAGELLKIDIVPAGGELTASVGTFEYTLVADERYILVASGMLALGKDNDPVVNTEFKLFPYTPARLAAKTATNTDVLVFHGIADAGEVSVWLRKGADKLFAFEFGEFQDYLELPTDNYDLEIRSADGTQLIASYVAPLKDANLKGRAITLLASGLVNPSGEPTFGLFVALPEGGALLELPEYVPLAKLQVIHNSADPAAEFVDIYLNGELVEPNFAFRTATPFVDIPAMVDLVVDIVPAGGLLTESVGKFDFNLTEDGVYVLVASGLLPAGNGVKEDVSLDFNLFPFTPARTAATQATNTDVLVFHGITDAPEVGVRVRKADANLFTFGYGEFAGYLELATADMELELRVADGGALVETYVAPLKTLNLDGAAITVVASGFLADADFGLFVALAEGGALVELPIYNPTALVQIIHNAQDPAAGLVDVFIDEVLAVAGLAYRTATPFLEVPAEVELQIDIVPAGAGLIASVGTYNVTFDDDGSYVVVAAGLLPADDMVDTSFNLFIFENARKEALVATNTDVLVFHGSADAPTVSVWAGGQVPAELFKFSFGEFTDNYLALPSNTYILEVRDEAGDNVVASYVAPLGLLDLDGEAITVLASGFLTGTDPDFGLFVALANGGALVPLPLLGDADTYALTLLVDPVDAGTVSGAGEYLADQMVTVTATAADGFSFLNWTDDDGELVSRMSNYSFVMPAETVELTANFVAVPDPLALNTFMDKTGANYPTAQLGAGGVTRSAALYKNRYVVAPNRSEGINIYVWDILNPHLPPTTLSKGTDVIAPLTFPVNYVQTVGDDIYIANLTLNPTVPTGWGVGTFKVYRWSSLDAEPEVVISFDKLTGRLGDAFSIVGDPKADGHIIAHLNNTSDEFRIWNFENGVLMNEDTPVLISLGIGNMNNHGVINEVEGETDIFVATSNIKGLMLINLDGTILSTIGTGVLDQRAYDPQIFYFDGKRYLSYTINNEGNADVGSRYQIVDISFGANVVDAFNSIVSTDFLNDRIVYDKVIGAGDASLTAINQVLIDENDELYMFAFVVNKGFILETTADLPAKFALTLAVEPAASGTVTGAGDYFEGATVPITATPAAGYQFKNWTLDAVEVSTTASFSYTMPAAATTLVANFDLIPVVDVATLAELRAKPADGTLYRYTGEAVIVAMDGFRNRKFLQDATAAIVIDDQPGVITTTYALYDVITNVVGKINIFNNLVRLQPTENTAASTQNTPVAPAAFTINELVSGDQAKLIKLRNVTFTGLTDGQLFANGTNYTITDGTNNLVVRTDFFNVDYIGEAVPTEILHLTGVVIQFQEALQFIPRFKADIEIATSVGEIADLVINVFPNPARDRFSITAGDMIRNIMIADLTGKIVYSNVVNDNRYEVAGQFEAGIYLVRIFTDEGVFVRKLQIQK